MVSASYREKSNKMLGQLVTRPALRVDFGKGRVCITVVLIRVGLQFGNSGNHQLNVWHVIGYACCEAVDLVIAEKLPDLRNETLASGEASFALVVALRHHSQVQETVAIDALCCANRRHGQGNKNGKGKAHPPAV